MNIGKAGIVLFGLAGFGMFAASTAIANPIPLSTSSPTYTFNPRTQGGAPPTSGTPVTNTYDAQTEGDQNATPVGLNFNAENAAAGSASYYLPSAGNSSGTLVYTFTDATPLTYFTNLQVNSLAAVFSPSYPGSVSGTYLTSSGVTGPFFGPQTSGIGPAAVDNISLPVGDRSTSITLTYTVTATSGSTLGVQLFRSSGPNDQSSGDYTFSATATFAPEPASLGLVSLGGLGLLARRRRI